MKHKFNPELVNKVFVKLVEIMNSEKLSGIESVYVVSAALRAIGESLYDKEDKSKEAVLADYKVSPSWPAALILISSLPHESLEAFTKERDENNGGSSSNTNS